MDMPRIDQFSSEISICSIRSREKALSFILPKFLGVIWERGEPSIPPELISAPVDNKVLLSASSHGVGVYYIGAGVVEPDSSVTHVFSGYIGSKIYRAGYRHYLGNICYIMSWKRGNWENLVGAEQVESRAILQIEFSGLVRPK